MARLRVRTPLGCLVLACALWLVAAGATRGADTASWVVTQRPKVKRSDHAKPVEDVAERLGEFVGARLVLLSGGQVTRVLSEGFESACDPDISFDGQRLLFAGRRSVSDPWRVWEVGLDGQGLRPVSPAHLEARSPVYVSTLFTLDSPEPWFTAVFAGRMSAKAAFDLYNVKLDGQELRQLTYNPFHDLDPVQRWDGRLVYAAESLPLEPGVGDVSMRLHAVHIEGADPERYGPVAGGDFHQMPCATEDGWVVFVEMEAPTAGGAGQLAAVHESRPALSYRRLTRDRSWRYQYPSPASEGRVIVSRRRAHGGGTAGLVLCDIATGRVQPWFDSPDYDDLQAKSVAPRPRPDGRSTIVNPKLSTGTLYGLNCYDAEARLAPHWRTGMVQRVRILEGFAGTAGGRELGTRRLVGEAPVETDGSFNLEVPADTPLLLQALDDQGLALATCGWIWVKPKESRGCIGCHEDAERTPENAYVLALRRPSNRLTLEPAQRRVLSFKEDIAPILGRHCASADCHGGNEHRLRLPLAAPNPSLSEMQSAYAALMAPMAPKSRASGDSPRPGRYVDPGRARTSWLVWQVLGRSTVRPWDTPPEAKTRARQVRLMPPKDHGGSLTDVDIRTLIQWIDLGASFEPSIQLGESGRSTAASVP